MTSRDFCFWLQGYLEIARAAYGTPLLNAEQVECVAKHLSLVFEHEIDPSMGPGLKQDGLNAIHGGGTPRC
jgi:hypothetical protein